MGDSPSRRSRDKTQFCLVIQPVNLVDHAIDIVGEAVPLFPDGLVIRQTAFNARYDGSFRANFETPSLQLVQHLAVAGCDFGTVDKAHRVNVYIQRTFRR